MSIEQSIEQQIIENDLIIEANDKDIEQYDAEAEETLDGIINELER